MAWHEQVQAGAFGDVLGNAGELGIDAMKRVTIGDDLAAMYDIQNSHRPVKHRAPVLLPVAVLICLHDSGSEGQPAP